MESMAIPYFPLECFLDDKFDLIEAEFGLDGFAVVIKLFQRIYGGEGYYAPWTNEVALLFARKVGLGVNVVSEIVSASIRRGIFDQQLYEKYQILTSKGIQERYFDAVKRRKDVKVKDAYLLISYTQNAKNADISAENADKKTKNVCKNQQRREEKRREEKRRGEEGGACAPDNCLRALGGALGKGVIYLTEEQDDYLLDLLGLDGYHRYMNRLSDYILLHGDVKNHYETILRWYTEDTQVKGG